MSATENKKKVLYFLVNPYAAQGRAGKWWRNIMPRLRSKKIEFEFSYTKADSSWQNEVKEAIINGYKHIIAIGGDGTINLVLNLILSLDKILIDDIIFGFWPGGTANDFGKIIFDDMSTQAFLKFIEDWQVKKVDIGKISYAGYNGKPDIRYFLNDFSIGLGADTCYIVNNSSKAFGGKISFYIAALKAILRFKPVPVTIKIDGEEMENSFVLISINNGSYAGGGMLLAPEAKIDDGFLDLVMASGLKKLEIIKLLSKVYKGKHLEHKKVIYKKVKKVFITSKNLLLIEVDGEIPGKIPVEVTVLPKILSLMIPGKK